MGRDHVTLHLHPWVRAVVMAAADGGPDSYPVLAVREVDTRLSLSDGDTVLVGGLETLSRSREREGRPLVLCRTALDGLLSATAREGEATEILFLVHVAILTPGRDPGGMLPPFEAERLLHRPSRARVVPAPLPAPERR